MEASPAITHSGGRSVPLRRERKHVYRGERMSSSCCGRIECFFRSVVFAWSLTFFCSFFLADAARAVDLTGNGSASVSAGDSYNFVYGRRAQGGDAVADGSVVRVTGGTVAMDVYGGSALSRNGTAEAVGNSVLVSGGLDGFDYTLYGGYARSYVSDATASGNSVSISGSLSLGPWATVYGGYAKLSGGSGVLTASGNSVSIEESATLYLVVGGEAYGDSSTVSDSFALNNTVSLRAGSVGLLYGGYAIASGDAEASGNTVAVYGGEVGNVVGGDTYAMDGDAEASGNSVVFYGGRSKDVIGASVQSDSGAAAARDNTVYLTNAVVTGNAVGAFAPESEVGATLEHNTVVAGSGARVTGNAVGAAVTGATPGSAADFNIVAVTDGGSVEGSVYGGIVEGAGSADHNTVLVRSAFVGGDVYGGEAGQGGEASYNSVIIAGGASFSADTALYGGVTGGQAVPSAGSGNTLFVDGWQGSVSRAAGFENLHFILPAPGASVDIPMLTVTGAQSGDFTGSVVTAQLPDIITGGRAYLGDTFTLVSDASGAIAEAQAGSLISLLQGYATYFDGVLTNTGTAVQLTIMEEKMNPRIAALAEARAASSGLLNQGADLAADAGLFQAAEAVRRSGQEWTPFAVGYGGVSRYHTGSRADAEGFSGMTGLAGKLSMEGGDVIFGGFFEFGRAHLSTFNGFASGNVHGTGSSHYAGGGLLARIEAGSGLLKGWYAEGVWRTGQISTSWYSGDLRDNMDRPAEYDLSNLYYGGHAGLGHVFSLGKDISLDAYGKFFWTRQEGDGADMNGENVRFKSVDSRRVRAGARLSWTAAEGVTPYAGAAWEKEFCGEAHVLARDFSIPDASLEGDSALFELGLSVAPLSRPFSMDIAVVGSAGERESIGGRLNLLYRF